MGKHESKKRLWIKVSIIILVILAIGSGILFANDIFKSENRVENTTTATEQSTENQVENTTTNSSELNQENQVDNTITSNETVENKTENKTESNTENKPEKNPVANKQTDIFASYYSQAEKLLSTMTLEEKVGQMFLVRYPESGVIEQIKSQNPGGYILFSRDFDNKTKTSMLAELNNCQANSKIKLALGVDEEGGTVVRVSNHTAFRSTKFLSPQKLWQQGQLPLILQDSKEKSALLKSIGLNMNLAPVADVPTSSSDFIYARSYGRGAEKTSIYVSKLITTMNESGMISTMKHFPGYGNNVDTHTGIAIDERPMSTFETSDFLPFEAGIEAKGPTILVNHNIVKSMDAGKPASLSENVHKILRENLNFSGIIMTDDLAMDAVKSYVQNGEAAVQAVIAGNDMIISSDFVKQKQEVVTAVKNGKISEDLINKAVKRILAWKYAYKII